MTTRESTDDFPASEYVITAHLPTNRALLRVEEVAVLLGVTARHVRNLLEAGDLEGAAIDCTTSRRRTWRVTRFALEAFWRERVASADHLGGLDFAHLPDGPPTLPDRD